MTDLAYGSRSVFLAERRKGIGGSDIAAILGRCPFRTPCDVWAEKTGHAGDSDETPALLWGNRMEPLIARRVAERFSLRLVEPTTRIVAHRDEAWRRCSPDRLAIIDGIPLPVNVQLKCVGMFDKDAWGEGEADSRLPESYLLQVLWELGVLGDRVAETAWLFALFGAPTRDDLRRYIVQSDTDRVAWMREAAIAFWRDHVLTGVMPDPTTPEDVLRYVVPDPTKRREATREDLVALLRYITHREFETKAAEAKKADGDHLRVALKDATALVDDKGTPLLMFEKTKSGTRPLRVVDKAVAALLARFNGTAAEVAARLDPKQSA